MMSLERYKRRTAVVAQLERLAGRIAAGLVFLSAVSLAFVLAAVSMEQEQELKEKRVKTTLQLSQAEKRPQEAKLVEQHVPQKPPPEPPPVRLPELPELPEIITPPVQKQRHRPKEPPEPVVLPEPPPALSPVSEPVLIADEPPVSELADAYVEQAEADKNKVQDSPMIAGPEAERSSDSTVQNQDKNQVLVSWLIAALEEEKEYPRVARRAGMEGMVVLVFQFANTGELSFISALPGSSHRILVSAAEQAAARVVKKHRQPPQGRKGGLTVEVPLVFELH